MIRNPLTTLESLRDTVLDIIRYIRLLPRFDVVSVAVTATPSTDVVSIISSSRFTSLFGAVQIGGTTTDVPTIAYYDNKSVMATYSYDASTSGRQTYRFLLIGT